MLNFEKLEDRKCLSYGPMPLEPVVASPPLFPDTSVADFDLESLYQSYNVDDISFKEMRELISSTADEGYTSRFEYLQLQRYLRLSDMPEYVRYFTDATLNGHYTTSDTIFFKDPQPLIDKWFNGKDLPQSNKPYIFVSGQLYVDGISPTDAQQGNIGDCYFITALHAISYNNPQSIEQAFVQIEDNLWVVRFYDNVGSKQFVTVNNQFPAHLGKQSVFANWGNDPANSTNELWPALLEKAYAQASPNKLINNRPNSYETLAWGDPSRPLYHITRQREIRIKGIGKEGYIDYLEQNKPIMINYNAHTYMFEYYDQSSDKFFLRNPYQREHIFMTWEELSNLPIVGSVYGGYVVDLI